ncbi:hypothetical protein EIP86_007537 [Pleurotus ostreatoroseus]|nr:hypothetical protein EIP86_007537 [Pleurotus ostreatoroseus]
MGTNHTLEMPGLAELLGRCVDDRLDLGTAYGRYRPYWSTTSDFTALLDKLREYERVDGEQRKNAMKDGMVIQPNLPPRRIWDLYSNRVCYWYTARPQWSSVCAVSHSWTDPSNRVEVYTPINEYKWRFPIPQDAALEHVRNELLNYGAEYAWLDVLCLRQADSQRPDQETRREVQWMTDVPTVGFVYQAASKTLVYLNGLCCPIRLTSLDDTRHWLNRTWTLQELSNSPLFGGLTKDVTTQTDLSRLLETSRSRFPNNIPASVLWEKVAACMKLAQGGSSLFVVLDQMKQRQAESDMDRIIVLARLLNPKPTKLPAYSIKEDLEDVWIRLVESMADPYRTELFLLHPAAGRGRYLWMPSWKDVKISASRIRLDTVFAVKHTNVDYITVDGGNDKKIRFHGLVMQQCKVGGLGKVGYVDAGTSRNRSVYRTGTLTVKLIDGQKTGYKLEVVVQAYHQEKIPETGKYNYTLVGTHDLHYWVVGRMMKDGRLEKVSVIRIEKPEHKEAIRKYKLARTTSLILI